MKKVTSTAIFILILTSLVGTGLFISAAIPTRSQPLEEYTIYADTLASPWEDWSWGERTVDFAATSSVYEGSQAVVVILIESWSGFQLGTATPLDISAYQQISFAIHGGSSGEQPLLFRIGDTSSGAYIEQPIAPTANTWAVIEVPLAGLGASQIDQVWWFNNSDSTQSTFSIDAIRLIEGDDPLPTVSPGNGPSLVVDAARDRRPISPYIYGMNFAPEDLAQELTLPVVRWGGNSTTRYNWQTDVSNRASDWYFENIPNGDGSGLPDSAASNQFIDANQLAGADTIITLPLIGWTPKDSQQILCGFSVSKYGAQQQTDPWRPDCGNGLYPDGSEITGNDPTDTSKTAGPDYVADWVTYLINRYGDANQGGVRFYNLDNEPMLWPDTHRDVHPQATSYDEMRERTINYAGAIKAADPSAKTLGPVAWGWTAYFYSALDWEPGGDWWNNPLDRLAHGDTPFTPWYLQQVADYEAANGLRLLDYLDLHYYPQSGVALTGAGDADLQALRLRSTRSLWDPTYVDESWIGEPVRLIPRMHEWVDANYPGTQLAITEYNFGALEHINGALAQADVLGIFGREGVDLATLWDPPSAEQPGAYAFRM